MVFFCIY